MILELITDGLEVESEKPIAVHYENRIVGTFAADLVVNGLVIVELKAKERLIEPFEAQLINYFALPISRSGSCSILERRQSSKESSFQMQTRSSL
jgi:GxxExxY protein